MTPDEFAALADQGHNRIPLVREVLADLDTPLSVYLKLAEGPYSYLFESVQGGEKWGRYSIIGLPCRTVLKVTRAAIPWSGTARSSRTAESADPLAWIEAFQARFRVAAHRRLAALHRRPGRLFRLRHHPLHRAAPGPLPQPGPARHPGHPAAWSRTRWSSSTT